MENNEEVIVQPETGKEEGTGETVSIPKKDYETLNQTIGSLKREIKDLKKPKDDIKETKETSKNQPEENVLAQRLENLFFQQANISHPDDIELARTTAKKWNMDIEKVLVDEDFKVKLEREQTKRSNLQATSNIRGGQGTSQAKNTPEYWIAKGVPPTANEVPDRKIRATIARAMMKNASTSGKTFYNS